MPKKIIILSAVAIVVLAFLSFYKKPLPPASEISADYKNATYNISGNKVTLKDGKSEIEAAPGSAEKIIDEYFGNSAEGDLNGDGVKDAVFILTENGGGTGTFYYAVAALKIGDKYVGTNGIFLGDRIAPQTTEIRNGYVIVNYADRGTNEPFSEEPTHGISKYLAVENGALIESPIFVNTPLRGASISSPLKIEGVAKGMWFFEASFPLALLDGNGKIIAQSHAEAQGDWMTDNYVPFSGTLEFTKPAMGKGTLVLKKDNPSGLPEHDDSREIPMSF